MIDEDGSNATPRDDEPLFETPESDDQSAGYAYRRSSDATDPPMRASRLTGLDTLGLWHRVTVTSVASDLPDLSARQLAVMLCVYMESGEHTVRSLAKRLNVTKAVISRAIDRLKSYGYIRRADDPRDGRSIVLRRTPAGMKFLRQFSKIIQDELPDGAAILRPR